MYGLEEILEFPPQSFPHSINIRIFAVQLTKTCI